MAAYPRILAPLLAAALSAAVLAVPPGSRAAGREGGKGSLGGVVSQADAPEHPAYADENGEGGPMDVFADVERGWKTRNVDLILRHFGAQKVTISIDGTGPSGGSFSRNQSYYLLKDLFRYTSTKKFEFVQYRKPDEKGRESFAIAERAYQKTDDGRLFKDKVYVSLHVERDGGQERWVIDEIKSIR